MASLLDDAGLRAVRDLERALDTCEAKLAMLSEDAPALHAWCEELRFGVWDLERAVVRELPRATVPAVAWARGDVRRYVAVREARRREGGGEVG
jgi:hypothetical protein